LFAIKPYKCRFSQRRVAAGHDKRRMAGPAGCGQTTYPRSVTASQATPTTPAHYLAILCLCPLERDEAADTRHLF
jgi:hypothetical protein